MFSVVGSTTYTTDSDGKFYYTIGSDISAWRNNNGKIAMAFIAGAPDISCSLGTYNTSNYTFTFTIYKTGGSVDSKTFYAHLVLFQQFAP